jgi:methionine-rich copper-binding protein CopC
MLAASALHSLPDMKKLLLAVTLAAGVNLALAHAHLLSSVPADASTLSAPPGSLVLNFSEAATLTAATIQKAGAAARKLVPLPSRAAVQVSFALPALAPGQYVVSWRALSADGHIMPGSIHFTIAVASGQERAPSH